MIWGRNVVINALVLAAMGVPEAQAEIRRVVAIAELGFDEAIRFGAFGGEREFFFPVPKGVDVAGATFRLRYEGGAAFEGRRALHVTAGDRTLYAAALSGAREEKTLEVAIPPEAAREGFVRIGVRHSGLVTDDRCLDERAGGAFFSILPGTALDLRLDEATIDTIEEVLALSPKPVRIMLPDRAPRESEAAAVLSLARLFKADEGGMTFEPSSRPETTEAGPPLWSEGFVKIAADDVDPRGAVAVTRQGPFPGLALGGERPESAAALIASTWRKLAGQAALATAPAEGPRDVNRLTFVALGGSKAPTDLIDKTTWSAAFHVRDLPANRSAIGVAMDLSIAPHALGGGSVASLFVNDTLLTAQRIAEDETDVQLRASFPEGLIGLSNSVRVTFQRPPQGGDCRIAPQGYPVQVQPSSALLLGPAKSVPNDFFETAPLFASGVEFRFVSPEAATPSGALPLAAKLAASLVPSQASIAVRIGAADAFTTPFIAFSETPPAAAQTPVRFDAGRVVIAGPGGATLLDLSDAPHSLVQIARVEGMSGLWARAAETNPAAASPVRLDRGNVAFLDADGVALAFSTVRDRLVEVSYPDRLSLAALAWRYQPWIVGAGWLALTIFLALALRKARSRRDGAS